MHLSIYLGAGRHLVGRRSLVGVLRVPLLCHFAALPRANVALHPLSHREAEWRRASRSHANVVRAASSGIGLWGRRNCILRNKA